jgi:ABC-2 type transport system ATP-binding protein
MIQVNNLSKHTTGTIKIDTLEIKRLWLSKATVQKLLFSLYTGSNSAVNGNIVNNGVQVNTSEAWKPSPHRS